LYLQNMDDFAPINQAFASLFQQRRSPPPARVTVEMVTKWRFTLIALVSADDEELKILQVTSRSEWAPQCIGPYSQACLLNKEYILCSGQIPLLPITMELNKQGLTLCIKNAMQVALAMNKHAKPTSMLIYCSTNLGLLDAHQVIDECAHHLVNQVCAQVVLVAVPRLPKDARVEVDMVATSATTGAVLWTRTFHEMGAEAKENQSCVYIPVQAVALWNAQINKVEFHSQVSLSV
jgi:enamine deaminase RidA (YjgF/YER057c/UK114 family)